jgi:cell division septum initiation protein DivIVA
MANDVIFKTKAFGGYNKEEVMTYINRLISEKEELESKLKELTELNNNLKTEVEEQKNETNTLEQENLKLVEKVDFTAKTVEQLKGEVAAAESEKEKQAIEILKLTNELNEIKNKSVLSEEDAEILKTENLKLKTECEKLKAMEQQVGAAMLDARLRSDELVKEAEEKAELVRKDVYDAIGDTALKIDELSGGIAEIASSFTNAVGEMEMRINVLTCNMSKTAQALISNTLEMPVRIQNSVTTEQSGIYDDVVNDIEMSLIEAEQELENMKESFSNNDQEHKAKIKIKAKPVSDE